MATWFWKKYDAEQADKKAESKAIADLKQTHLTDMLKMEGTLALITGNIERLTDMAGNVITLTEREAGTSNRLAKTQHELEELRNKVIPDIAKLQEAIKHLTHAS